MLKHVGVAALNVFFLMYLFPSLVNAKDTGLVIASVAVVVGTLLFDYYVYRSEIQKMFKETKDE